MTQHQNGAKMGFGVGLEMLLGVGNTSVVCSEEERLVLLKFKQSVKVDSKMLSSWVDDDCCRWERVRCDGGSGHVKSLDLRGDKHAGEGYYYLVGGEVNSSLAKLRHLAYLDLSGNDFEGSRVPKFIGSLKQLSYLNLSGVGFQGIIPHHIGNLSNLKVDLSSNRGPMPDEPLVADDVVWTFGVRSLEHLDKDMLLYMIPSLKFLSLSNCRLSGALLGPFLNSSRILPNIEHLDLGLNSLEGPLPGFFHNLTSLAFLDLSGFEPSSAWNFANLLNTIPSLSELHLSNCGLDKTFLYSPHLNFSTLSNIQHLNLRYNSIEGIIQLKDDGGVHRYIMAGSSIVLTKLHRKSTSWVKVLDEIVSLEKKIFPEHVSLARSIDDILKKKYSGLIYLEINGDLAGYVMYSSPSSLCAIIIELAVKENYRRQGHGDALLKAAIEKYRSKRIQRVPLHVYPLRTSAMNLYKKLGFQIDTLVTGYYSSDRDAYRMYIDFDKE